MIKLLNILEIKAMIPPKLFTFSKERGEWYDDLDKVENYLFQHFDTTEKEIHKFVNSDYYRAAVMTPSRSAIDEPKYIKLFDESFQNKLKDFFKRFKND